MRRKKYRSGLKDLIFPQPWQFRWRDHIHWSPFWWVGQRRYHLSRQQQCKAAPSAAQISSRYIHLCLRVLKHQNLFPQGPAIKWSGRMQHQNLRAEMQLLGSDREEMHVSYHVTFWFSRCVAVNCNYIRKLHSANSPWSLRSVVFSYLILTSTDIPYLR